MALFLPNSPPRSVSPELGRAIRALKNLPDDGFIVWQRLAIGEVPGPDFLILKDGARAVFVKVSAASPRQARITIQPELLPTGTEMRPIGEVEREALDQFVRGAARFGAPADLSSIPAIIAFPNIPRSELQPSADQASLNGTHWISMDELRPEHIRSWIEGHLSHPLELASLEALRRAFTPEVVVPASMTVRAPIERNTAAGLTDYLLDYDQEWVLKCDLDLSKDADRVSRDLSVRLINGVAGSGKSLIIVYRALLLRRFFPDKRILVLTHNRPLIRDLQAKYELLSDGDNGVEWRTFLSWCLSKWPNKEEDLRPIGQMRRQDFLSQVWAQHLADTTVTKGMLQSEVDWFKDRTLSSRSEYLAADRTGRGFALQESMRNRVFDGILSYQKKLDDLGLLDWGDIPRKIWGFLQEGVITPTGYDAILVDEAQFFAPIWFEIIKSLLNPSTGHLFLAADPTQGFLGRGRSWIASGLEVRGRSHRLNKSYRTTRRILDYATWLYRTRIPDEQEDIVIPNLSEMPDGVVPMLIPLTSPQDEITRVVNEIVGLVASGVPRQHVLVIHADWQGVERLITRLNEALGPGSAQDPKEATSGRAIRVCTLNATTGLESPVVFLVGLRSLYEQEQSLRISDEERVDLIRDNTRKIYMAITRAGQRIVITYSGELPDWLKATTKRRESVGRRPSR
ncbi:MAG: UvrD-helicase domain-containing protein [Anaerolineales bacterium]